MLKLLILHVVMGEKRRMNWLLFENLIMICYHLLMKWKMESVRIKCQHQETFKVSIFVRAHERIVAFGSTSNEVQ